MFVRFLYCHVLRTKWIQIDSFCELFKEPPKQQEIYPMEISSRFKDLEGGLVVEPKENHEFLEVFFGNGPFF